MQKVIGYIVSIVGLALMALGFGLFGEGLTLLQAIDVWYVWVGGLILVGVGVVISMMDRGGSSKATQEKEEVPIYRGQKIVGYRREGK